MDFKKYKEMVAGLTIGKQLPDAVYIHKSQLKQLPTMLGSLTVKAAEAFKITPTSWNIAKFQKRDFKISYLNYPDFDKYAYPALKNSRTVDLTKYGVKPSDYSKSKNPPILHRKETFVADDYKHAELFREITAEGEAIGLYENVRSIGFKNNWERLISNKGYYLDETGRLCPKADEPTKIAEIDFEGDVKRHKTAIARDQLSAPMKLLAKHGFLDGQWSVLDYGCGRGDDIKELEAHGMDCIGWDPVFAPEAERVACDIVNLGYVLNVIEEREERTQTLKTAWEYADKMLITSVMVAGESVVRQFKPYKDGVITQINTFQKYYSQSEFRSYLESSLGRLAIAVGQGIFVLFKDANMEQEFLIARQQVKRDWKQLTQRERPVKAKQVTATTIEKNQELFDDFWGTILDLGRPPANDEFEFTDQLRRVAKSNKQAFNAALNHYGEDVYEQARQLRKSDLLLYFALGLFEKRQAYTHMPSGLKRDVKAFFEDYKTAINAATLALYSVGDPGLIETKANEAYESLDIGEFIDGHSWIIHRSAIQSLPVELRIYIGCGTQLYGDIEEFDLVKIHFTSGKVSLMRYDDWSKDTPMLVERVKIKLRELDIDFFDYEGKYDPTPLENKQIYQ